MPKSNLKSLKKHFYLIQRLSGGRKFTIQHDWVRCHTAKSVTSYLTENVPHCIRKENWPPISCYLSRIDRAIWEMI